MEAQERPGELRIRRGRVVNADGARDADVRLVGETIAEIRPRLEPGPGSRVIDASHRLILPAEGAFAKDWDRLSRYSTVPMPMSNWTFNAQLQARRRNEEGTLDE
jgi:hypothetical protein